MGTIYEKLNYLDGTKGLIREAINDKGGTLTTSNTFREYANAITNLPTGSGAAANILCKVDFTRDTLPVKNISFRGTTGVDIPSLSNYTPNPLGLHEYDGVNDRSFYVNMFVPLVNNTYSIKFGDVHANNLNRDFLEIRGLTVGSNGAITFSNSTTTNTVSVTASDSDTAVDLGVSISDFSNKTLSIKLDLTENSLGNYTTATWNTFKPYLYIYLNNTLVKRIVYDHVISVGYRDFSCINRNIYFMNISTNTDRWYPEILEIKCTANATTEDLTITNLNVTENGTYTETGKLYDTVTVNVEGGGSGPTVEALTVTQNGTYSESGKAYSPVTVNLSGYNTTNASGALVSVTDSEALPLSKLNARIRATQDLHGYDKPWAGGAGKNKADNTQWNLNSTMSLNNGVFSNAITDAREYFRMQVLAYNGSTLVTGTGYINIETTGKASGTININAECTKIRIKHNGSTSDIYMDYPWTTQGTFTISFDVIGYNPSTVGGLSFNNVMIEAGSTATTYEPYSNICPIVGYNTVNVFIANNTTETTPSVVTSLGSTYYGGTLNVLTGELSVNYGYIASYNGETLTGEWISDRDEYVSGTTPTTGAEVAYRLDGPIAITLDEHYVVGLDGNMNVWANSGPVAITYFKSL